MRIPFTKMHGLGNDFVVIDATKDDRLLPMFSKELICKIADRHFGVGCDQVLVLGKSPDKEIDFFYHIFNADGSEAGQCINGVRCLAKFVNIHEVTNKKELIFATKSTKTKVILEDDGQVTAIAQAPIFTPEKIPFVAEAENLKYELQINDQIIEIGAVFVGNPHAVVLVDDVDSVSIDVLGSSISNSKYFPEKANVSFMQILDCQQIKLRVYERGSGETLACGSGACAAVIIGKLWGFLNANVVVKLPGGDLVINWEDSDDKVLITGPAEQIFIGEIILAE